LLNADETEALVATTKARGGQVSYRTNRDGSQSPYELNITLFDALNDPLAPDAETDARRFLASQVIMLSLAGVPGIYILSLFGSRNWHDGVSQTGRARTINRQKFERATLETELADPDSPAHRVFREYRKLLRIRCSHPAFHPNAPQKLLTLSDAVFGLVRTAPGDADTVVVLVNATAGVQTVVVDLSTLGCSASCWRDLIGGEPVAARNGRLSLQAGGYQSLWLRSG
jgi:sucrose phosphorylase